MVWVPELSDLQAEFVASTDFECLFGGRAGVGKTFVAALDVCGLNRRLDSKGNGTLVYGPDEGILRPAIFEEWYRGIIIRRTEPELGQIIEMTHRLYPKIDPKATWHQDSKSWTFSSGAKIRFGYLKLQSDALRYQGDAYHYVLFEELTHHATDYGYTYLKTRIRADRSQPITLKLRATTNPGGPGHRWVKERFRIKSTGEATHFVVREPTGRQDENGDPVYAYESRRFISARGRTNPFVDPTYVDRLTVGQSLQTQRALRDGLWDDPVDESAILRHQLEKAYEDGRVTDLPILSGPAYTFWDLGTRDQQCVWIIQPAPDTWFHVIGFYQNSMKPLSHYKRVLDDMASRRGFTIGGYYLPHDARQHQQNAHTVQSKEQMFHEVGMRPTHIAKRVSDISTGIEALRARFSRLKFDRGYTESGLDALQRYSYKRDNDGNLSSTPDHANSHAADALRTWATGYRDAITLESQLTGEGGPVGESNDQRARMLADARRRVAARAVKNRGHVL
jgi:hypothetical protein